MDISIWNDKKVYESMYTLVPLLFQTAASSCVVIPHPSEPVSGWLEVLFYVNVFSEYFTPIFVPYGINSGVVLAKKSTVFVDQRRRRGIFIEKCPS